MWPLILIVFLLLYGTVTFVFWRNIKFLQPWKAIFCGSVFPVFALAIVANIAKTDHYLPGLLEAILDAHAVSKPLGPDSAGDSSLTWITIIATSALAPAAGWLWYLVFKKLNSSKRGIGRTRVED